MLPKGTLRVSIIIKLQDGTRICVEHKLLWFQQAQIKKKKISLTATLDNDSSSEEDEAAREAAVTRRVLAELESTPQNMQASKEASLF